MNKPNWDALAAQIHGQRPLEFNVGNPQNNIIESLTKAFATVAQAIRQRQADDLRQKAVENDYHHQAQQNLYDSIRLAEKNNGVRFRVSLVNQNGYAPGSPEADMIMNAAGPIVKEQKPATTHYGPTYGMAGKYYQSAGSVIDGKWVPMDIELGGEPTSVTVAKNALAERYTSEERAQWQQDLA